jgi:hypothetical protein
MKKLPIGDEFIAPIQSQIHSDGMLNYESKGMTLRDYFAGQALMGYLSGRNEHSLNTRPADLAPDCYKYADAMMAARKETK